MSVYNTFMTIYFGSVGCTPSQIGTISAAGPLATIAGQYIFGRISDILPPRGKNILIFALYTASAALLLLYRSSGAFVYLIVISMLYTFFNAPEQQLSDALSLDYSAASGCRYSIIRMGGTIGYAIMAAAAGAVIAASGDSGMFACVTALTLLSGVLSLFLPRAAHTGNETANQCSTREKVSYFSLFRDKRLTLILLLNFLIYICISFYISFFPVYLKQAAGGDSSVVGRVMFALVLCEVPFLLFAQRIEKRFGTDKILIVSCFAMALRWGIYASTRSIPLLAAASALHGLSNITTLYCSVSFIQRSADVRLRATGQTTLGIVNYGLARIVGNFAGGFISEKAGIPAMFAICSVIAFAAGVIYIIGIKYLNRRYPPKTPDCQQ